MPLSSCFSPLITAAGRGCCEHRAVTKLHRDGECEKDEHAPFFMLLSPDYSDRAAAVVTIEL